MVEDNSILLKLPQWPKKDARKEFPNHKVRFESFLCQKDGAEALKWKKKDDIPPDSKVWSTAEKASGADVEGKRLQKLNAKACGCLINSILTSSDEGEVILHMVEKTMSSDYPGGNFVQAYTNGIVKRYEEKDTTTKAKLQEEYYGLKMETNEDPSVFMMKLEKVKIKLERNHKVVIEEKDFVEGILEKLPKEKDVIGPYQVAKQLIEHEIKEKEAKGEAFT